MSSQAECSTMDGESREESEAALHPAGAMRTVLTIAGFDPSSGAGLSADLKVFAAHRLYGVAAATALTVQSTRGVRSVEPVSATLLAEMLACLAEDLPVDGIKIGMLATAGNVDAVADFLALITADSATRTLPIVLDPVLCSSSGHALLAPPALDRLRERLLPLVTCATPNLDELMLLALRAGPIVSTTGSPDEHHATRAAVEEAAAQLAGRFPALGIVATGGHLGRPDDCIVAPGGPPAWLAGEWIDTPSSHGTGCAHSSSLLCGLVQGLTLFDAAYAAKRYVTEALRAAVPIGQGGGSMHHLYAAFASQPPAVASQVQGREHLVRQSGHRRLALQRDSNSETGPVSCSTGDGTLK